MISLFIVAVCLAVLVSLAVLAINFTYQCAYWFGLKAGIIVRLGSFWVGAHYSEYNKRWCINYLPCVTVWVVLPGGTCPGEHHA